MIKFLIKIVTRNPIKVMLVTVLLVLVALFGALSINLATGNDTLVKTSTKVYQDNAFYEETFGSDPILVLLEKEDDIHDLALYQTLHQITVQISQHEAVFTANSNASLIVHMLETQEGRFKEGIKEMGSNLLTMSLQIESNQAQLQGLDPEALETMQKAFFSAFEDMENGQVQLSENLMISASNLLAINETIDAVIASLDGYNDPHLKQQGMILSEVNHGLNHLASGLMQLQNIPVQTSTGLNEMSNQLMGLFMQLSHMSASVEQMENDLVTLANGLNQMGTSLLMIHDFSNAFDANFPKDTQTLEALLFEEDTLRSMFAPLVIDDSYQMMSIVLTGDLSDETKETLVEDIETIIVENYGGNYLISGKPVLDLSIKQSMMESMQSMLLLSISIMVVVLFITFKVKWRLLPLLTILLAVIATVGIMGWLNIPVTMVSMAVFPILIGLGIDYAIQFQSRYDEYLEEERV